MSKGAILGIGNVLQRDDGIGIKLLKYIESQYQFPEEVELIDGGTCGATLNTAIIDKEWLIILDALMVDGQPGEIRVLAGREFINRPPQIKMSPHQVGFLDLLQLLKIEGYEPKEIDLIGIIPEEVSSGNTISTKVDEAVDPAMEILLDLLGKKGINPIKRNPPLTADYWWQ